MTILRCALVASTLALHLQAADRVFEPFEEEMTELLKNLKKAKAELPEQPS